MTTGKEDSLRRDPTDQKDYKLIYKLVRSVVAEQLQRSGRCWGETEPEVEMLPGLFFFFAA